MSRSAWIYIWSVLAAGAMLTSLSLPDFGQPRLDLPTFAALTVLATLAQLFEAVNGRQSYYPHFVFFFAGVLLLDPFWFVLLVIIPHVVELVKERWTKGAHLRAWYIQPFNICVHIIAGSVTRWLYTAVETNSAALHTPSPVVAAIIAALTYIGINHILVGQALVLARGISWRDSGVLDIESLLPDFIMSCLGYIMAVLWQISPWLSLPALSPLVLMYRALMVPQLKKEAQTDGKTGLSNASYFNKLFMIELERAKRFDRPLAVIMADLDLLRNINNTYGHLAGDAVLAGIGLTIRQNVREYDIAGRFGGEEFAIVLPETRLSEAMLLAERLREAVEAVEFEVGANNAHIHVTMSLGVACFPEDAIDANALVHEADVAVYQAKLKGRNCVVCASEVPHSIELTTTAPIGERMLAQSYGAAYMSRAGIADGSTTAALPQATELSQTVEISTKVVEFTDESLVPGPKSQAIIQNPKSKIQNPDTPLSPAANRRRSDSTPMASVENHWQNEGAGRAETASDKPTKSYPEVLFRLFVAGVIVMGAVLTAVVTMLGPQHDMTAIGLLTLLAIIAELLQINVYGENTVSVSVALVFAAALIGGIPGVACVSAAIALAHRFQQRPVFDRTALYKTAFNWSTHVLAGAAPVIAVSTLNIRFEASNLILLAIPTVISALAYYVIETGLITTAISLSRGASIFVTWRDQFRWLINHYLVLCIMGLFLGIAYTALGPIGVIVFTMPILMMRYAQKQYVERTKDSVRELKRMNQQLTNANKEVIAASSAMQQLNEELFLTLSKIIDARDPYVAGHAAKVSDYTQAMADELELPLDRLGPLRQAGFLHDIGKIGISEQVLHKPAKLTPEEYEYVKTHAPLGGEFLEMSQSLRHLAPFVRHHHERWDGTGYPDRLRGEEIPLEARILAVCDAVEAMASDRPYRKGMTLPEIIAEVKRCAGTQFDPIVCDAFVRVAEREREQLVINSAHEVDRKQHLTGELGHSSLGNGQFGNGKHIPENSGPLPAIR